MTSITDREARVALVHEWVAAAAGSEQVFDEFAGLFPYADLYALSRDPSVSLQNVGDRKIMTTFLDRPWLRNHREMTAGLMPLAWRALGSRDYDLTVTSHHAFAHTHRVGAGGVNLVYVHSPARYLWSPEIDGRGKNPVARLAVPALKAVDKRASLRPDGYAANSSVVGERIRRFWGRDSVVIHPPVQVDKFASACPNPTRDYVLGAGRWIDYKSFPLIIHAADRAGRAVKIAGRGPDEAAIRKAAAAARVPVEIIESPSDSELKRLYENAACLVFPGFEDFGMVPVEAQAAGTPVAALRRGGALDTVVDGVTGSFFDEATPAAIARSVRRCELLDAADCTANARLFGPDIFARKVKDWIGEYGF